LKRLAHIFLFIFIHSLLIGESLDSLKAVQYKQTDTVLFKTLLRIGNGLYNLGQLDSASVYFSKGYKLSQQAKNDKFICDFLLRLGLAEREKGVYNKSSEYYYLALEIADKYDYKKQKASIFNGIAILASIQGEYDKAIEFYTKGLEIYKSLDNLGGQGSVYNNIGLIYLDQKKNSTALKYFFKALEINTKLEDDFGMAVNCENIGLIYHELNDYPTAYIYYGKALKIWYKRNDDYSKAINLGYNANTLLKEKKWYQAIDTLQKALDLSNKINSVSSQKDMAFYLSTAYEGANDPTNALKYYKLGKSLIDSIQNEEKTKEITEIQLNYAFNKIKVQDSIKHQMEVQVKENQLKAEKNYKYIISIVLVVISILLFFVFKNYKEKTKANNIITEQKNLVEQKQQEILDSMIYARRIQTALLANKEFIDTNLHEHFILMKPKDIVSGDFYWSVKKDDKFYLAACDSTGHGVPGAFMSLLNMGFLNEALIEKQIKQPNEIFNYVRERLINSIGDEGQQDGFDGVLLCIDLNTKQITYSASNKSPIVVSRSGITILHSDKMPVGKGIRETPFNLYQLDLHPDDTLYLYTDGYADQFGGPKGKKFMYKQLNQLLVNISEKPMHEQRELLNNRFEEWKGDLEQVDDVLVVGIKI
jgi:serine phosphatase RsbU (regulator of sigma subunit)/Tfp pilus assembly protein PilF